jgi:hypothetical protein
MLRNRVGREKYLKTDFPNRNPIIASQGGSLRGDGTKGSLTLQTPTSDTPTVIMHPVRLFPDCHHSDKGP